MQCKPTPRTNFVVSLDSAIQFAIWSERSTAALYRSFALGFSHYPVAADFWREMTKDELQHAMALQHLQRCLAPDVLEQPADDEITGAVSHLGKLMISPQSIVTLEHAYQAAHERENSELNALSMRLVAEFAPDIQVRRRHTVDTIRHTMKLFAFSRHFGGATQRSSVALQGDFSQICNPSNAQRESRQ